MPVDDEELASDHPDNHSPNHVSNPQPAIA
jgi:hypothetical protein